MPLVLTLIASATCIAFFVALATGVSGTSFLPGLPHHMSIGTIAALLACTVHCIVFTYFLGTGLSIKEAVTTYELDESLAEETRTLKKRSFPWVFNSILLFLVAVATGGFSMAGKLPALVHGITAAFAVAFSIFAFYKEFGAIRDNVTLLMTLKKHLNAKAASLEWPPASDADITRVDQGRALVFLGFSTAFAYFYLRYITRTVGTPFLPFALAAGLSVALGTLIIRTEGRSR